MYELHLKFNILKITVDHFLILFSIHWIPILLVSFLNTLNLRHFSI